jgi:hypothetical protein
MTTARGLTARAPTLRTAVNAFTVDLEEWFHVCGVPSLSSPQWNRLPARVTPTITWLLDLLCHHDISATFVVDGSPSEIQTVRQIAVTSACIATASTGVRAGQSDVCQDVVASCRAERGRSKHR